jgi:hypothetical protein
MDEVRLINATPLEKEMQEYALYIRRETTNECESTAECCADMVSEAPTIDPETLRPTWCDPEKNPPEVETEVLVLVDCGKEYCITTAHYEDGNVFSQDSEWNWEDLPDWGTYDEERDDYRIPEGWWEYRHFNPDDVYNNKIDCTVMGWMPLPEKVLKNGGVG